MCVCVCVLTLLTDINVVGSVQAPRNRKLCVAWCLSSKGLQSNMRIIFTFNLYCSLHLDYIFIFQHEGITLFLCYFQFVTLFTFSMLRITTRKNITQATEELSFSSVTLLWLQPLAPILFLCSPQNRPQRFLILQEY